MTIDLSAAIAAQKESDEAQSAAWLARRVQENTVLVGKALTKEQQESLNLVAGEYDAYFTYKSETYRLRYYDSEQRWQIKWGLDSDAQTRKGIYPTQLWTEILRALGGSS